MCIIHMRVQCSDRFSEMLVDDVEYTEMTIESIVGTALLEVFDNVQIENITVHHPQNAMMRMGSRNSGDMLDAYE